MRRSVTLVLSLGLHGCVAPASPPPSTDSAPSPSVPTPLHAAAAPISIPLCVVDDDALRKVEGAVDAATGDTLVNGRPFSEAYPLSSPPYAGEMPWYHDNTGDFIDLGGTIYVRYGIPRDDEQIRADPSLFVRVGDLQGVPIFAVRGESPPYHDIFLPVRPGCALQPYQRQPGDHTKNLPLRPGSQPVHRRGAPAGRLLIATPVKPAA